MEEDIELEKAKNLIKNSKHILTSIICQTYMRDKGISEDEFKERIGYGDSELSEKECIKLSIGNFVVEKTKLLLKLKNILENNVALLQKLKELKENRDGKKC